MNTRTFPSPADFALLPRAPKTGSRVPELTSLYHNPRRGEYGDARYPGNCSGNLIRDLLAYFEPQCVLDPMTGSGTCYDVCRELGIHCVPDDLHSGRDAAARNAFSELGRFDFVWLHPPYWRMKQYSNDIRDLSTAPSLDAFLDRYERLLRNCVGVLEPYGHLAVLMGDYCDRDAGFVPLTYHTKRIAFDLGLRQRSTDIIRFSHGASSATKTYRSSFIPGLHDVCMVFEKPGEGSGL